MFPPSLTLTDLGTHLSERRNAEIIRWHAEGIRDAIVRRGGGGAHLRKIRIHLHGDDGDGSDDVSCVVGLAGWVVERCRDTDTDTGVTEVAKVGDKDEQKTKAASKSTCEDDDWIPEVLDVLAWLELSAALRDERERVVGHLENVCRMLSILSIPIHHFQMCRPV